MIVSQSIVGPAPTVPPTGFVGPSAYDIAVLNGFVGNEAAWLASLHANDRPYVDAQDEATRITAAADASAKASAAQSVAISAATAALLTHEADHANPHGTTAAQVGAYTTAQTDTLLAAKADTTSLTSAWFETLFLAWVASLPVYSGSGPAPVPSGQPFNNGGVIMIAQ
jgi:hypothetical protein